MTIVQVFKTTFRVVHMVYSSHLYPRAEPRGFTLQWIKLNKDKLMRVVIDDDVDFLEKYDRMYSRKSVGRKHNHQPSSRYNERLAAHHKRSQHISSQH